LNEEIESPQGPNQAAKISVVVEIALSIGCSMMALVVIFGFPITAITIVFSFMLALIGFTGSLGIGFEGAIGHWSNHMPRWKHQFTASIAGLILGAVGVFVNVEHIMTLFAG